MLSRDANNTRVDFFILCTVVVLIWFVMSFALWLIPSANMSIMAAIILGFKVVSFVFLVAVVFTVIILIANAIGNKFFK